MTVRSFAVCSLAVFAACGSGGKIALPTGFIVKLVSQETTTTTLFRKSGDNAAIESKGTLGTAPTCANAMASSGTLQTTLIGTRETTQEVIGQTSSAHPLVPNADTFGPQQIAVVKMSSTFSGEQTRVEGFVALPPAMTQQWTETQVAGVGVESAAAYFGIVVDEYYLLLASLASIWVDFEVDVGEAAEPALEPTMVPSVMLTRYEPATGDIWASVDGRLLYVADGKEDLTVGSKKISTNRVKVYTVKGVDPTAADVLTSCITQQKRDTSSTAPGVNPDASFAAFLNPNCATTFVHAQIGTQWWYKGAMVKESTTTSRVEIVDYGYEWSVQPAMPPMSPCTRVDNQNRNDDAGVVFAEYRVITTTAEAMATELTEGK